MPERDIDAEQQRDWCLSCDAMTPVYMACSAYPHIRRIACKICGQTVSWQEVEQLHGGRTDGDGA
jgi:transcription elongation factor Elf1